MPSGLAFSLLVVLGAATLSSQPRSGDFVGASGPGVYWIDAVTGRLSTLLTLSNATITQIEMAQGDGSLRGLLATPRHNPIDLHFFEVRPQSRSLTTLAFVGSAAVANALLLDQDGSYVAAAYTQLHRITTANKVLFLRNLGMFLNGLVRDEDTGDYVVAANLPLLASYLVRVDPISTALTTFYQGPWGLGSAAFDQRTGSFWARSFFPRFELRLIDRSGATIARVPVGSSTTAVGSVRVDQATSDLFFVDGWDLKRTTAGGTVLRTWSTRPVGLDPFVVFESRKISGSGSAKPGSFYQVALRFPESPGASYCGALSFSGLRPGIPFGGGRINIVPDWLFYLTIGGGLAPLTRDFVGSLGPTGTASAAFYLPPGLPRGTVLVFCAVAVNPRRPFGLDVGDSITIRVL